MKLTPFIIVALFILGVIRVRNHAPISAVEIPLNYEPIFDKSP